MLKRIFFIVIILYLNMFDIAKSEDFFSNCPTSEHDFCNVNNPYPTANKSQKDSQTIYLNEPSNIETNQNEKLIPFIKSRTEQAINDDGIHPVAAGTTTATLGIFSPLLTKSEKGGIWFRPYAAFENVPFKNGPTVKSIAYGGLIGINSDAKNLKNKWQIVNSGYLGYTGTEQSYDNVKRTNMSGFGGIYSTFYRNDFFSAIVLTAGTNVVKSSASEDITGIYAGVISRTGYNIKLPHNLVFQPNYIMAYTFDNTFDYKNNNGETVKESPLSIIHFVPSARFFANLKDGWQPFIIFNMNFNVICSGDVSVNDISLPSVSVNPYIEYGGGVQRFWKDKYSTFVQVLARNGGRNGVTMLIGLKWTLNK